MKADHFRQLVDYHFAANRKLWEHSVLPLTDEQFKRKLPYSVGSVRNQVVHMLGTDDRWFSALRGLEVPPFPNPVHLPRRETIRQRWDRIEADMRAYLTGLQDDDLDRPFEGSMQVWQVLFHVLNHGTDHRAQLLSMLHQLDGVTFPQDYAFFVFGRF